MDHFPPESGITGHGMDLDAVTGSVLRLHAFGAFIAQACRTDSGNLDVAVLAEIGSAIAEEASKALDMICG